MVRKRKRNNRKAKINEQSSQSTPADDSKAKFLAARQFGSSVVDAARWAGVSRTTLYRWRRKDPGFAQAWHNPMDKVVKALEFAAFQRAIEGNDRLLVFLLKSYNPDGFNEKRRLHLLSEQDYANWRSDAVHALRLRFEREDALRAGFLEEDPETEALQAEHTPRVLKSPNDPDDPIFLDDD